MSIPTSIPSNRTFGIEVEFVGLTPEAAHRALTDAGVRMRSGVSYNHQNSNTDWKIVTDGSLSDRHGRGTGELVSPILSGMEGLQNVIRTITALNNAGATVNRTCGLHVHIGASDLTVGDLANIGIRYAAYESVIDSWMPVSRRANANHYCGSMTYLLERPSYGSQVNGYIMNISNTRTVNALAGLFYNRYQKVNYQALTRQSTIEFRQHSGTCNAEKITNWIVFLLAFVEKCRLTESVVGAVAAQPVAAPRTSATTAGRRMPYNVQRIADTIDAMTQNPTSQWQPGASMQDLRTATLLRPATIRAYVSQLRSMYGYSIRLRFGRYRMISRGSQTALDVRATASRGRRGRVSRNAISSHNASVLQNALVQSAAVSGSFDGMFAWLGLPAGVRNFYEERVEELAAR